MTTPAIPTFPAGYAPLPSDFTTWVQQNFTLAAGGVIFRGQLQAAQALASASALNALQIGGTAGDILEDPFGGWSTVSTGGQAAWSYLVPVTGWYEVTVFSSIASAAVWAQAGAAVSGGTPQFGDSVNTPSSVTGGCCASIVVPCYGGTDYIQAGAAVSANCNTASASAGKWPTIEIAYLSGG